MSTYEQKCQEDARLAILAELARQGDATSNSRSLLRLMETLGLRRSEAWLENQLRRLEEMNAVNLRDSHIAGMGRVIIATLTRTGRDHVERRALLAGVTNPADEE